VNKGSAGIFLGTKMGREWSLRSLLELIRDLGDGVIFWVGLERRYEGELLPSSLSRVTEDHAMCFYNC